MRFIYLVAVYLAAPVISAILLWRGLWDRGYWHHFGERFGLGDHEQADGIWIHAVSVGEVQAAAPLVNTLRRQYPQIPVIVTTFTPTGAARARALFKDVARVRYIPYDLPGSVRRFFDRVHPRLAVIFETELWPNLYRECSRRRVPLVLASARLSPRSVGRYRRLGALFSEILSRGVVVAAQGEADADRFRALGADPASTHVTGNLKFDFTLPPDLAERAGKLRRRIGTDRPLWVAGSTHGGGEEQAVLQAHRQVRAVHPDALLVLAPRHPNRFTEVAELLLRERMSFTRRSQEKNADGGTSNRQQHGSGSRTSDSTDVLLLDTLGELLEFYAAADVAFVGGSLVPVGGHNLLEPAAVGLPVLTGPNNFNSEDVARMLLTRGAAEIVHDARQLGDRLAALLSDPDERERIGALGRAAVENNRGALVKLLNLIEPLLAQ